MDITLYGERGSGGIGTYVTRVHDGLLAESDHSVALQGQKTIPGIDRYRPILNIIERKLSVAGGSDVAHFLSQGWLSAVPETTETKTIVTVHDLIQRITSYEGRMSQLAALYNFWNTDRVDHIIANSNHTADDLITHLDIEPSKITTIYYGIDTELFRFVDNRDVLREYGLQNEQYLLHVGATTRRKNISRIIDAFSLLSGDFQDLQLVFSGSSHPTIKRKLREVGIEDRTVFLGWVPQDQLPHLYSHCECFVFPSLYEGFGRPPVEALACGAPVVVSDRTSLPEVVGEFGSVVDPCNPRAIADQIINKINSSSIQQSYEKKREYINRKFNWQHCIKQVMEVYKTISRM